MKYPTLGLILFTVIHTHAADTPKIPLIGVIDRSSLIVKARITDCKEVNGQWNINLNSSIIYKGDPNADHISLTHVLAPEGHDGRPTAAYFKSGDELLWFMIRDEDGLWANDLRPQHVQFEDGRHQLFHGYLPLDRSMEMELLLAKRGYKALEKCPEPTLLERFDEDGDGKWNDKEQDNYRRYLKVIAKEEPEMLMKEIELYNSQEGGGLLKEGIEGALK